jgi:tetratricopeptide (TPR) repeat protein
MASFSATYNNLNIRLCSTLTHMDTKRFLLSAHIVLFVAVMICGCINNASSGPGNTSPTPVPAAVDLHNTGFDAYVKGDNPTALEYFNQSIAADPTYTRAWIDKGNVLVRLNRSEEAIVAYDAALVLDNGLAVVWNKRGEAQMATGNYIAARDSFDRALKIAPGFVEAKENRDLVLKKLS